MLKAAICPTYVGNTLSQKTIYGSPLFNTRITVILYQEISFILSFATLTKRILMLFSQIRN